MKQDYNFIPRKGLRYLVRTIVILFPSPNVELFEVIHHFVVEPILVLKFIRVFILTVCSRNHHKCFPNHIEKVVKNM